ncbi:hypothetical protein V8C86DRAFT_2522758, partial [Haematococcus lacustris]
MAPGAEPGCLVVLEGSSRIQVIVVLLAWLLTLRDKARAEGCWLSSPLANVLLCPDPASDTQVLAQLLSTQPHASLFCQPLPRAASLTVAAAAGAGPGGVGG